MHFIKQLEYSLPSVLSNFNKTENFIDKLINEFRLPQSVARRVTLCMIEAVNNSMLHGNKLNPEKMVNILAEEYTDRITIIVEDEGKGFDYTDIPDPMAPENITQSSGRGLYLMSSLSDELTFCSDGRKVVMSFLLNEPS